MQQSQNLSLEIHMKAACSEWPHLPALCPEDLDRLEKKNKIPQSAGVRNTVQRLTSAQPP